MNLSGVLDTPVSGRVARKLKDLPFYLLWFSRSPLEVSGDSLFRTGNDTEGLHSYSFTRCGVTDAPGVPVVEGHRRPTSHRVGASPGEWETVLRSARKKDRNDERINVLVVTSIGYPGSRRTQDLWWTPSSVGNTWMTSESGYY